MPTRELPAARYGRDREMELVRTLIIMYANGVRPATPVSNRPQLLEEQKNVLMDLQADGVVTARYRPASPDPRPDRARLPLRASPGIAWST